MIRTRITWLIAGGVVALLVVAGIDALRSSDSEATASTRPASTTTPEAADLSLPRCTRQQITVSIEIRGGIAKQRRATDRE
jgi:putative effector of murein hydrolase